MRGRYEHHKYEFCYQYHIRWKKYVQFKKERGTKTRSHENQQKQSRAFNPEMWETVMQPNRYPVRLFQLYVSKKPKIMCQSDSPYLAVNWKYEDTTNWYKAQPMGIPYSGKYSLGAKFRWQLRATKI